MEKKIPIYEKVILTVEEAMAYSGIGEHSLREALKKPSCPFVFYVGKKSFIKRKEFDSYISKHDKL